MKKKLLAIVSVIALIAIFISISLTTATANPIYYNDPDPTIVNPTPEIESTEELTQTQPTDNPTESTIPPQDETETQPETTKPEETEPAETQPAETIDIPEETTPESPESEKSTTPQEPEETKPPKKEEKPTEPPKDSKPTEPPVEETPVLTEPDLTQWVPADENLYVQVDSLNIRKGPGTNYDKLGSFKQNDLVHKIGVYDNNWCVIEYKGGTAFVWEDYLGPNKITKKMGDIGRLTIPAVGVDVALYNASLYSGAQAIVDRSDSAAYMKDAWGLYNSIVIADHWNQGFNAMKSSVPDSTRAYIDFGDYVAEYICVANFKGHNTGKDLTDENYNRAINLYSDGLMMYTCNDHWSNVTITFWAPIGSYGHPDTYLPEN